MSKPIIQKHLPKILECEAFRTTFAQWLQYKGVKAYKLVGMRVLVTRAAKRAEQYGVEAVCRAMETAMANGWSGWDFERSFTQSQDGRADPRGNHALANRMLSDIQKAELESYGIESPPEEA